MEERFIDIDNKINRLIEVVRAIREDLNMTFEFSSRKQKANDEKFEAVETAIIELETNIENSGKDSDSVSNYSALIQLLKDDKKEEKEELFEEVARVISMNKPKSHNKIFYLCL